MSSNDVLCFGFNKSSNSNYYYMSTFDSKLNRNFENGKKKLILSKELTEHSEYAHTHIHQPTISN